MVTTWPGVPAVEARLQSDLGFSTVNPCAVCAGLT